MVAHKYSLVCVCVCSVFAIITLLVLVKVFFPLFYYYPDIICTAM